ncbi:hypothetical protein ACFSQ3_10035 [Sphingobacterium corticis]|uniref:Uncharacterized protein n=1 Tax=Sphingobacterium corticis TaxID=1812823 RepID=A0ABW5NKX3_9SPHI
MVTILAAVYAVLSILVFQDIPAILHIGVFVATYWFLGSVIGARKKMKEALAAKEKHSDSDQQNNSEQLEST